jgi:hypothetical protein
MPHRTNTPNTNGSKPRILTGEDEVSYQITVRTLKIMENDDDESKYTNNVRENLPT